MPSDWTGPFSWPDRFYFMSSRSVSRVLFGVTAATAIPLERPLPAVSSNQPGRQPGNTLRAGMSPSRTRPPLFGLAPGGVCPAASVAGRAVRSYRTFSPLPAGREARAGGSISVALSLGSPPAAVSRHRVSMEPGLSSPCNGSGRPTDWTRFPSAGSARSSRPTITRPSQQSRSVHGTFRRAW